tara:strand:- start:495 stop:1208 length:714 start_codon:yes stop_codon:yes gene_type:complete
MEAYVFYSHFDYSDVWPFMFGQSEKYLKNKKKYLITNETQGQVINDWTVINYDDKKPYQERVSESLSKIKEDIVVFHHEDMFLMEEPRWKTIDKLVNLVNEDKVDLIRLTKGSYDNSVHDKFDEHLFYSPKNLLFSLQPTIIKKEKLIKVFKHTKGRNIWEFEANSNSLLEFLNYRSCYYYQGIENKRGLYHWDSIIYPYIATAVVKGKWDYQSYPEVLNKLMIEYEIDPNKRGKNA